MECLPPYLKPPETLSLFARRHAGAFSGQHPQQQKLFMDCLVFLLIVIFVIFVIIAIITIFMLNLCNNCDGIPNHKKIMWFPSPPS